MIQTLAITNHFELFGLAPRFKIDLGSLEQSYRRLQVELHPDRHASENESERRLSLQLSTKINDAYRALLNPASRAQCLIELAGKSETELAAAVSPAFLMAQMEWRETIEQACNEHHVSALEALSQRLCHKVSSHETELAIALDDQGDLEKAAQRVNELRFYEKLRARINDALDRLDS